MKLVKNLLAAVVLVFALAVGSYAGDQQTPGYTQPPPPPAPERTPTCACAPETADDLGICKDEDETPNPLLLDALIALLSRF